MPHVALSKTRVAASTKNNNVLSPAPTGGLARALAVKRVVKRHMKKRLVGIFAIVIIHAVLSMAVFLQSFSLGMRRFDSGAAPSASEHIIRIISKILFSPLFLPLARGGGQWFHKIFAGPLGYVPLFLNSLVWGAVIWTAWEWAQRRMKRKTKPGH